MDDAEDTRDVPAPTDQYRNRTTYLDRDYQSYSLQKQVNLAPVDDDEENRLRGQHSLLLEIFKDRKNPLLPDFVDDPEDVLDCGYGTGDWAYELAETLPDCNVLAVDISPIMELGDMPDNLTQEIVDLNDPFTFPSTAFDFVHSRFVVGGLAQSRWPSYLTDIKRVLRSTSWVQLTEWELVFRSENGDTERLQSLRQWSESYLTALASGGGNGRKSRTIPDGLETMLRVSGFVNVSAHVQEVPTCGWPSSSPLRKIGEMNKDNMQSLIRSIALYPVTSRGILTKAEFDTLTGLAISELSDQTAKPYLRLYTIYGQKP